MNIYIFQGQEGNIGSLPDLEFFSLASLKVGCERDKSWAKVSTFFLKIKDGAILKLIMPCLAIYLAKCSKTPPYLMVTSLSVTCLLTFSAQK